MDDILEDARKCRTQVATSAVAHRLSAEHHRHRGVKLGAVAAIISAIVGSTVFVTLITRVGLNGKGTISVPSEGWAWAAYLGFAFLSILAPVLTGLQTFLNDPEQAAQHTDSWAEYSRLEARLTSLIRSCNRGMLTSTQIEDAEKEMEEISNQIQATSKKSLQLTEPAIKKAEAQIRSERSSGDEAQIVGRERR